MSENTQTQRPWFFNLAKDGDNAIVRLLHSEPSTIEKATSHRIEVAGKKKRIKCNGDGCPLCENGNDAEERIYIHLYDYMDNREKVWERTNKILPQIEKLFESWKPLNSAVVRITRRGNEFPKYDIEVQNPMQFETVSTDLVDKTVSKMFYMNRNAEDIKEFLNTGKFPERKPYVPKSEYKSMSDEQKEAFKNEQPFSNNSEPKVEPKTVSVVEDDPFADDDPFAGTFSAKPRKV